MSSFCFSFSFSLLSAEQHDSLWLTDPFCSQGRNPSPALLFNGLICSEEKIRPWRACKSQREAAGLHMMVGGPGRSRRDLCADSEAPRGSWRWIRGCSWFWSTWPLQCASDHDATASHFQWQMKEKLERTVARQESRKWVDLHSSSSLTVNEA